MSIKRNLLVVSFLLLASAQVFAVPSRKAKSVHHVGEIKFGPQIGGALGLGVFGEYAISDTLGVQVSLGYLTNGYSLESIQAGPYIGKNAAVVLGYINLPIILRAYPGEERQFCWLGGLRIGYVANANFILGNKSYFEIILDELIGESEGTQVDIKDIAEQDKISRFQVGVVAGFDYEFKMGLTLGFAIGKDFIKVLQAKDSSFNWTSGLSLGYNFGRFLD